MDRSSADRGEVAKATISVPDAAGLHAFRIRVGHGDEPMEWHDRVLIAGREPVSFDLPIALNDPIGDYDIRAIDVFTNEAIRVAMSVR